ncbi:Peptidase M1 alanine aminopeptidase/leukotriene A4 hydrolase [Macrophomina phaseolina MS6]|uniref:Aminopeptidase n=1 Tax=Macrophomina phaseolina (strain MS6) TaxID=1126212 RepID=K2RDZ3_MACPH|nr:Peptidase M1 alanine aminopeptidase/leukotriene A4 hydrolase [Macrophomina phaseolina MS6]
MHAAMASDRDILPDTVKPSNYAISLYDLEFGGAFGYQGTVTISSEIRKPTKEIVLNSHQLKIHEASVVTEHTKTQQSIKTTNISYDETNQRATLAFDQELPASSKAEVTIKFQGTINNLMAGFYRSKYKPAVTPAASVAKDDEYHYMFSTQFESCDARRAFPCFDEPNLKATFDFEIEVPEDQTALSNMPEKETKKASKSGFKVVSFEKTPVMSTYLLAWAVGDFEYVEDFTRRKYNGKSLPVRVYTTRGLKEQGQFALEHAHKTVDYFSEIFRIEYPLPKVDLIAVHEFSHGAMENWGLITYRTTAVLFDPEKSDQKYKNRVAYVVAHELAHQWFGNLVTMDWWSELWLNEGFATWVGWLAVDHLHPEWNVWGQFCSESLQSAFNLDSLRNSHPIEVPVRNALEVDQIFDHISYLKGSSVIRMLSAHLGVETFLLGVSQYLNAHKFGNATTNDLWSALSKASGQDVNTFMDPWIRKIGFPVVTVAEEPGQISVQQRRFLLTGDVQAEEDQTTWWIPLGLKTASKTESSTAGALTTKEDTIRGVDDSFYKLNADQTGFYRTNYPPERLLKLGENKDKLSIEDKIGLIGDAAALAQSGDANTAAFLALLGGFQSESEYIVWQQILLTLGNVRSIFSENEEISKGLRLLTRKLVTPATDKIGWEFAENEDFLKGQLRSLLISAAGLAGHEGVIKEAQRRFSAYQSGDKKAIHPSLRGPIFRIVVTEGGEQGFEAIKQEFLTNTSIDGREICLQALGRVQTPELAKAYLDFLFSPAVPVQDMHSGAASLAANSKTRHTLWAYIKEHWDTKVYPELSGNMVVLDRFIKLSLAKFASFEVAKDVKTFFADKDCKGFDRALAQSDDIMTGGAKYRERDSAVVKEWLSAHSYL